MNKHDNQENSSVSDKINLDYDWNSEYGDGDIPDIDKNSARSKCSDQSSNE